MPSVFISYSWDSLNEWDEQNEHWVNLLAKRLICDKISVSLDKWNVKPGDSIPQFMEKAITENDKVLIICTPRYKYSSDHRKGAVGYESHIISSLILQCGDHRKFITIIKQGDEKTSVPTALIGKCHIFLNDPTTYEKNYQVLINAVHSRCQTVFESSCFIDCPSKENINAETSLNLSFALLETMGKQEIKIYIAHYKNMLKANSFNARGWFGLGLCTLHYNTYDSAIMQFKKAILLDGSNADYYYYLAIALCKGEKVATLRENTIKEVEQNINKAIELNDEQAKYFLFKLILYKEWYQANGLGMPANDSEIIDKIHSQYRDFNEMKRLTSILKTTNPVAI